MSLPLFDASKAASFSLKRNILDINKAAHKRRKKKPIKRIRRKVAKGAPKAPLNFRAVAAATEIIELTWDDPQDRLFTYTIEHHQGSEVRSKWKVLKAGLAGNTYLDKNCFVDVTYYYRIFATDESGRDGHMSKPAKSGSANGLGHFKRLWNRANAQTETIAANPDLLPYERFTQLFDNLCLVKAFQASRQGDRDAGERESRASAVFIQTKEATEEAIITNAFGAFAHLHDIPTYLDEKSYQKSLPKETRDFALADSLRPAALREAFDVFYFAGVDLVKKMGGLIYVTACRKLVDVIASDKNINNECEHSSKKDREARAKDPSKPQRFNKRADPDAAFNDGKVRVLEFADHTFYKPADEPSTGKHANAAEGSSSYRSLLTAEEKATRVAFIADSKAKEWGELGAFDGTTRGYKDKDSGAGTPRRTYTPDNMIVPDESMYVIPQIVASAADLADATDRDCAVSYELIFGQLPDLGRNYIQKRFFDEMTHGEIAMQSEGSSDKKSVRRIERLGVSTFAQAKAALVNHKAPVAHMTAPVLLEAIIEASKASA
jgi:hypothetical protein